MPQITVKALAELIGRPAYDQLRILREQKYPRREPQIFRTPYYQPAVAAITRYYRRNNDPGALGQGRARFDRVKLESRRRNLHRVLDTFERSDAYMRQLEVRPKRQFSASVDDVEVRLSADLLVHEDDQPKVIFLNCRQEALDEEYARRILFRRMSAGEGTAIVSKKRHVPKKSGALASCFVAAVLPTPEAPTRNSTESAIRQRELDGSSLTGLRLSCAATIAALPSRNLPRVSC